MLQRDGNRTPSPRPTRPPTVQALVSARIDALPQRLRQLARAASAFFVSFDLEELHTIDPEATEEELRQLEDAEVVVREERRRGPQRWRLRHATVKGRGVRQPAQARARAAAPADRRSPARGGRHVWAADHLELAALASLDLDPDDRTVAERAAEALVTGGTAPADGWRAGRRSTSTSARSHSPARGTVGRPRGARAGRDRRGALLAGEYPPRPRRSTSRSGSEPRSTTRSPWRSRCDSSRHRDQRRRRRRPRRAAARRVARRRGAAGRAVGARAHPAVRRVGAVDAPPVRGGRRDLASCPRGRRS